MPRYIFEINGQRHIFEGPDQQTTARFAQQWAATNQSAPVTLGGTAKSFGSGVLSGAAGLADLIPFSPQGMGNMADQVTRFGSAGLNAMGLINKQQAAGAVNAETNFRRGTPFETNSERVRPLLHAPQNTVEKVANAAGEFVPNAFAPEAGAGGLLRAGLRAGARVMAPAVGSVAAPAAVKAMGGDQTAQNIAQVAGGAAGGASPDLLAAGGQALRDAALGTGRNVSPEVAALAQTAIEKHGIPLQTWQIQAAGASGDRAAAIRGSNLIASDPRYAAAQLAQKQAFTNAAGKTFGATGPLTTDTMAAAKAKLSAGFEDHASRSGVAADDQLKTDLTGIGARARELGLSDNEVSAIDKQIAKIGDLASTHAETGVIPADAYQAMTQSGSALAGIIGSGHGAFANQGAAIRSALSDAAARAGGPESAAQLADLRSQWAAMKTVEPLAEKAGPEGLISPSLLQGRVNATYDNAAYGSGGDLAELGDIGQTFLKEPGNSQTAPRWFDKAKGPAAAAAVTEAANLAMHNPQALATTAGAAALGWGANKGLAAIKSARGDNPVATNALLTGSGAPMPARVLNALASRDYTGDALIPGALATANAFQPDASTQ